MIHQVSLDRLANSKNVPRFYIRYFTSFNNNHQRHKPLPMPLLSLPAELLREIISLALNIPTPVPDSCEEPSCSGLDVRQTYPCTPTAATRLSHTCHVMRSHALPLMYASVTVNHEHSGTLHELLTTWPHIASCVRILTVFITNFRGAQRLHGIIKRCSGLQDLRLDGSRAGGDFIASLLAHAVQSPLRSLGLRTFEWPEIRVYLCMAPRTLHTLRLEDPVRPIQIVVNSGESVLLPRLPSVRTFICHTELFDQCGSIDAGSWLAHMFPNVHVLDIKLTDTTIQFLEGYATLGTPLTELTVHFLTAQPQFCVTVAHLVPTLRRFTAHGGTICEVMFAPAWRCIEYLDIECQAGCEGVNSCVMRQGIVRLVGARPRASVRVALNGGRELVVSDQSGANVAPQEAFGALEQQRGDR